MWRGLTLTLLVTGCGTAVPAVSATADPITLDSGGRTTLHVEVEHFELVPRAMALRAADHGVPDRPQPIHVGSEGPADSGYYAVHLDAADGPALAEAHAERTVVTVIGAPGPHALVVRLRSTEGLDVLPQVEARVSITLR